MSDCIIPVQPLEVKSDLKMVERVLTDKPIHCVYAICDPRRTGGYLYCEDDEGEKPKLFLFEEPFYVGQTSNMKGRKTAHILEAISQVSVNHLKDEILNDILLQQLKPIFILLKDNLYQDEADRWEKYYIKLIGRQHHEEGSLVNVTEGGDKTTTGLKMTEQFKKLQGRLSKERWADPEFKRKVMRYWEDENNLIEKGKISKRLWTNPEYIDKCIGARWGDENKKKEFSNFMKNLWASEEYKRKRSCIKRKKNGPRNLTSEQREKLSKINKATWTHERKEKMSKTLKEKWQNPEQRAKFIASIPKNKKFRRFLIIDCDEHEFIIDDIKKFCEENNLKYGSVMTTLSRPRNKGKLVSFDESKWKIKRLE